MDIGGAGHQPLSSKLKAASRVVRTETAQDYETQMLTHQLTRSEIQIQ